MSLSLGVVYVFRPWLHVTTRLGVGGVVTDAVAAISDLTAVLISCGTGVCAQGLHIAILQDLHPYIAPPLLILIEQLSHFMVSLGAA
jgi:hypothetical protein